MTVTYPLFAFEKDDSSMRVIETPDRILSWHEAIDIENDEYVFWDATGSGVQIRIDGNKVLSVTSCAAPFSLTGALEAYADSLNVPKNVIEVQPVQIWQRIELALKGQPRKPGWLSRIFSR
jgi:hypothetical protein